jgi:hypothetical protein
MPRGARPRRLGRMASLPQRTADRVMLRALLESSGWTAPDKREVAPRPVVRKRRAAPGGRAEAAAAARAKRPGSG